MNPKVSIIIPCYNQAAFLPKAIASLQAQTLATWECIVVDDGSTDNTAEVAANIALQDPRVRWIQKTNGGLASARNAGMIQARGEFIQFLDADDTIAPEKLERQVTLMEQQGLDISYTAFCYEINRQQSATRFVRLSKRKILVSWGLGASVPIHSFLYRTTYIQQHKHLFGHSSREDWKWHINCFSSTTKQAALPNYCGAIYYMNEQGMTGSYIKMQEGNFTFMAYMAGLLKGFSKVLWAYRTSEELWIWMLRMIKHRSTAVARTVALLVPKTGLLLGAILMMPISLFSVLTYFIKTYIAR